MFITEAFHCSSYVSFSPYLECVRAAAEEITQAVLRDDVAMALSEPQGDGMPLADLSEREVTQLPLVELDGSPC